jgi:hypothetical protein
MASPPARAIWTLRMQRKNWSDYEKAQKQPRRTMAICAAVAAIHVVIIGSFLTWHGEGHRLALLVPVRIIPAAMVNH